MRMKEKYHQAYRDLRLKEKSGRTIRIEDLYWSVNKFGKDAAFAAIISLRDRYVEDRYHYAGRYSGGIPF